MPDDTTFMALWLPRTYYPLSQLPSEGGSIVTFLIQMRNGHLPTSGLGQPRQLLRSSNLTKLSCHMSFKTFQFCFLHKRTMFFFFWRVGDANFPSFVFLYTQGTLETHCVPCKYCVSGCQVYGRCNMLLSSRLLCHMPPYCCFGCFHGKSLYGPRKEPI